jgi:FkbM family methyltransferase
MNKLKRRLARIREQEHPVRFLTMKVLAKAGVLDRVPLKVKFAGVRMRLRPGAVGPWVTPNHPQLADMKILQSYLRPGDVFVDVGANVGRHTLCAARCVGPEGSVVSFEPHPRVFGYLTENIGLNGFQNVTAHNAAVGDSEGEVHISDAQDHDTNTVATDGNGIATPVHRLDDVVPPDLPVRMLKIDAEGYEKFVLDGAPRVLQRTDCIFIEVGNPGAERFGYDAADLVEQIRSCGFTHLYREVLGAPVPLEGGPPAGHVIENLVAVRDPATLAGDGSA